MKITLIALSILLTGCAQMGEPYLKAGLGYKFRETNIDFTRNNGDTSNSKITARFELGYELDNITYGVSHHSQPLVGWPTDNRDEYAKTEFFVDYLIKL